MTLQFEAEEFRRLRGVTYAGEHVAHAQQGSLLTCRTRRVHRVAQHKAPIVEIACGHDRGHHADIGADAREDEVLSPAPPQEQIQLRAEEGVIATLGRDDEVALLWFQASDDVRAGGSLQAMWRLETA